MINRKIFLLYFVFVFTNIFCFGQEENDFFEFYAQYRAVKSHDHSLLLGYSIKEPFITYGITSSQYHKYQYHDYFLDVWSNIHYGFVGRFCGFSEGTLLTGSDFQQFIKNVKQLNFKGGDDLADKITMQLGMDLYSEYKDRIHELNYQVVLDELEKRDTIGHSRLLHKCFDTSEHGVTYL